MLRICFVCLGNICRSPTAEGVMLQLVADANLGDQIRVDSAGTSAYHAGERADPRSRAAARRHGIDLTSRSRQFVVSDFDRFDHVVAMDAANMGALRRLARNDADRERLSFLRSWDATTPGSTLDVPDPYYGAGDGFEHVFQICRRGCEGLLDALVATRKA